MNRFIIFLLLLTGLSCHNVKQNTELALNKNRAIEETTEEVKPEYGPMFKATIPTRNPYEVGLKIESIEDQTHALIIDIKLFGGAHYISPFSEIENKGRFTLNIKDENLLNLIGGLAEIEDSTENDDLYPLVNDSKNWINISKTYKQPFLLNTEKDFKVQGVIQFTLEPRNTREYIPFSITSKNSKLEVMIDGC